MAFADRREVPDLAFAALVLEVDVNELRQRRRQFSGTSEGIEQDRCRGGAAWW